MSFLICCNPILKLWTVYEEDCLSTAVVETHAKSKCTKRCFKSEPLLYLPNWTARIQLKTLKLQSIDNRPDHSVSLTFHGKVSYIRHSVAGGTMCVNVQEVNELVCNVSGSLGLTGVFIFKDISQVSIFTCVNVCHAAEANRLYVVQ